MNKKLVRDNIPKIIETSTGEKPLVRQARDNEILGLLKSKLVEEVQEFKEASEVTHQAEELADILEVVFALGDRLGVTEEKLEQLRFNKAKQRGRFRYGYILETK